MQIVSPTKVFDNLIANNNNNYVLPDDVIDRISILFDSIGFTSNTPNTYVNQFNSAPTNKPNAPTEYDGRNNYLKQQARKQQQQQQQTPSKSWKAKPTFAVTKFALLDESETIIDNLRAELNKLNSKTFDTRTSNIINLLNELIETCSDSSDDNELPARINDAFTMFFETAVNNKNPTLYVKFFAKLYEVFSEQVSMFLNNSYNTYLTSFDNIVDVSESDYNEFCDFTAANMRRKGVSELFANIVINGFMPNWNEDFMNNLLNNLFEQVIAKVELKTKQKEVEEITENIVVLFTSLATFIKKGRFLHYIETLNNMKPSDKPGLTSRTKFKYMDLR